MSFVDLAPTVLTLAGSSAPTHMQGKAFLGLAASPQHYAFGQRGRMDERYDMVRTVTDGRWRYIRNYMPHRPAGQVQAFAWMDPAIRHVTAPISMAILRRSSAAFSSHALTRNYTICMSTPARQTTLPPRLTKRRGLTRCARWPHAATVSSPDGGMTERLVASHGADLYPLSEVMALADTAARRDPALVDRLTQGLTHSAEPMRYWAAMGLLILGHVAQTATDALTSTLANDSSPQVQIVTAEALAANGPHQNAAIAVLRRYLGGDNPLPVRLQPINALTCYGPSAEGASAEIEAAAVDENQYIRSAGGYLTSLQNGSLAPPNQFSTCSTCSNRCSAAPDGSEGGGTS